MIVLSQLTSCETHYKEVGLDKLELRDSLWYENKSNELFTGRYLENYETGELKSMVTIENGKVNGKAESYYKNGAKAAEINYRNGVFHGKSDEWFEDGQLSTKATFCNGELDGYSEKFFENGLYDGYSYYRMGELDSLFRFFPSGKRKSELKVFDLDNSTLKEWDSTGILIFQITQIDGEYVDGN